MSINQKFNILFNDPNVQFTIILGSGLHSQFIGSDSILSSWELLLKELNSDVKLTGDYHLDFEKIIESQKLQFEDSSKTEGKLLRCIKLLLKKEQERVLRDCKDCYPLWLFNPKYVSDVVSLNFDEIPEKLLNRDKKVRLGKFTNKSSFNVGSKESYSYLATRFRTVDFGKDGQINFWHPHGVNQNNKSIILGLHKYSHILETSIRLRKHHMKLKKQDKTDFTWYQAILKNPIIIIGAGMSSIEWDLWFALISQKRANNPAAPIFQMRECECKNDVQHAWFQPLFTGMKFDQQWSELEKMLNKKRRKKN
jgi:hypothetical protein